MWYSGQSYELRAGRNHWFKEGSIISKLAGGKLAPSFIHSFFGSVSSDVQVPTSLGTEDAAVNEADKTLARRNLYSRDRKPHSQWPFSLLEKPQAVLQSWGWLLQEWSHTGHQEVLPATYHLKGRGCRHWQCEQGHLLLGCPCFSFLRARSQGPSAIHSSPQSAGERCMSGLRGMMDWGTVEVNHCLAWRTRRLAQRTGHAKSSIVLPHRGELKIPFFPKSQINKVLEDFQIGKENCYHQLSIKTDWWVVFWSRSLYLASDPDKEMTARGLYWKCIYLWAGGTNKHHCAFRSRNHGCAWIPTTSIVTKMNFHKLWVKKLLLVL